MSIPEELEHLMKTYDDVNKCTRPCGTKIYKRAKAALDDKYKNKYNELFNDAKVTTMDSVTFNKALKLIDEMKRHEVKTTKEFVVFYGCALKTCKHKIDELKAAVITWLKLEIKGHQKYIRTHKNDIHGDDEDAKNVKMMYEYAKNKITENQKRLFVLQKTKGVMTTGALVDILYASP